LDGTGSFSGSAACLGQQPGGETVDERDTRQVDEQVGSVSPQQVHQALLKPGCRVDVDLPLDADQSVVVTSPHAH
jgi:hypothetical protein